MAQESAASPAQYAAPVGNNSAARRAAALAVIETNMAFAVGGPAKARPLFLRTMLAMTARHIVPSAPTVQAWIAATRPSAAGAKAWATSSPKPMTIQP